MGPGVGGAEKGRDRVEGIYGVSYYSFCVVVEKEGTKGRTRKKPSPLCCSATICCCNSPMALVLVGNGTPAGVYVSHMTRMLSNPSFLGRKGSRKILHGRSMTSESSPGAWPVELPSKFHRGRASTASARLGGRVRVFERHSPLASTQTYSARILSSGYGRELNRSTMAVSSWDLPVWILRWLTMCSSEDDDDDEDLVVPLDDDDDDDEGGEGAKAAAALMAAERMATESFMLLFWMHFSEEKEK